MTTYKTFESGKYHGMVNTVTGDISAYSGSSHSNLCTIEANANDDVNAFPYTDKDFVILAARTLLR